MLFGDIVVEELLAAQVSRSPSYHAMLSVAPRLEPLSSVPVRELTSRHCESVLSIIPTEGPRSKVRMLMTRAVRRAMSEGLLERDPLAFLPKMRTTPGIRTPADNAREVLELADVRRLVTDPQVKHPEVWAFLLTTGCRVGEAAAVTANDIRAHGDVSVLTVRAQKHARWGDVRETKAVSVREVVMPTWAVPTKFPLFEVSESRVLQWWHADLKRLGIASRRVHATRHTFITVLARLGVGVEIIRDMTHPRGSDAFSQYLHPEFNQKIGAARRLSTAILGE